MYCFSYFFATWDVQLLLQISMKSRGSAREHRCRTSGCPGFPMWPIDAARSLGPMNKASTPGTCSSFSALPHADGPAHGMHPDTAM